VTRRTVALVALLSVTVLPVAVGAVLASQLHESAFTSPVVATPVAVATPLTCHSVNALPDPICTPGVVDPRVTQANIEATICVSGYTAKARPSTTYIDALKVQQIKQYGYTDTNPADYEEDHLIPLELGGHPTDRNNLWPEPRSGGEGATKKDAVENSLHSVENSLHSKVCVGLITLAAAQAAISKDWPAAIA